MHIVGVPVADGYKKGLSKQVSKRKVFTKELLSRVLQDELREVANKEVNDWFGEQIKEKSKGRNHDLTVAEYKVAQETEHLEQIQEQVNDADIKLFASQIAYDIFANAPNVKVIRQSFKLPEQIRLPIEMEDKFSEWLGKAEIAYRERLGAGAVIYLRSIFEKVTHEVGLNAGVEIYKNNGKAKPFEQVLKAVDAQCSIIPAIYSQNGYDLFSKLSEIAHGNSDEATALKEYESLRRLVVGIIENVKRKNEELKNNTEIQRALNEIGFNNGGEEDV